jgi:collagenase-like PrtC family protease
MRVRATAKVKAVAPEGCERLVQFLRAYRDAVQEIVNELWRLKKTPSKATLHKAYYNKLRSRGFRAHHASEIYKRAREIVEATKGNGDSRPSLRRLTARIHSWELQDRPKGQGLEISGLKR